MPRKKLSEFRAKTLLYGALGQSYEGIELDAETDWRSRLEGLAGDGRFAVKVDQAEKGRFKKGLVKLDQSKNDVYGAAEELFGEGYRFLLVEPYRQHEQSDEHYLALSRTREGVDVSFSRQGGVDIEAHPESIAVSLYEQGADIGVPSQDLGQLVQAFDDMYAGFLEVNPLIIADGNLTLLDAAAEVDSEAEFFEVGWHGDDLRSPKMRPPSAEEQAIQELAETSQASFSLEIINPDGRIFVLLSGGGASVTVADEVNNLGAGRELANYGEYSGNPTLEETQIYTTNIVRLLLKSSAQNKVLIIGGGVANFTDVRATFRGVINALKTVESELQEQGVKVYVRRGGPYQQEGLALIRDYLESAGIIGYVAGPELPLSDIVGIALGAKGAPV